MKSNCKLKFILIYFFILIGQVFSQGQWKHEPEANPFDRPEPAIANISVVYKNIKDNQYKLTTESKVYCKFIVSESGSIIDFKLYSERSKYVNLLVKDLQKLLFAPKFFEGKPIIGIYFLTVNFTKNCSLTDTEIFKHLFLSHELIVPIKD